MLGTEGDTDAAAIGGDASPASIRVGVIGHALRSAGGLVVGRGLISGLIEAAPENDYCFIVPDSGRYEVLCRQAPSAQIHPVPAMRPLARLLFDTWRLPRILGDFSPDVVLALDSSHGFRRPPALQGVFLQAAHLVYPNDHYGPRSMLNRLRHAFLKWHFGRSLRRTAAVFVQTEVMASRLRRAYPFAGEISVAGSTLSGSLRSVADEASPPEALAPYSERFKLLSVAHYYPHKGVERIIDAFRRFPDELADVVVFLTLDSRQHPRVPGVLRSIEELGLSDRIVNLGEVHHDEIGKYYLHCDALLKPSTLESFGMTYIEAMAWGLPILTSDMDFAHEACGDAALYFDPLDPRAMRDAIVELRDNPTLLSQLASAGRATVHFERSWSDIGAEVLQVMAGRAGADHRPGRTAGG